MEQQNQNHSYHLHKKLGEPPGLIPIDEINEFFNNAVEVIKASPMLDEFGFQKTPNNPNVVYEVILEAYICSFWLRACVFGKTINNQETSYGFKHQVEAWLKFYPNYPISYISNSAFILAYLLTDQNYVRADPNILTTIKKYPDLLTYSNYISPVK